MDRRLHLRSILDLVHGKKFVIRKQNLLITALWLDKEREDWEEEKEERL